MEPHLLKRNLSGLLSMTNNLPRLIEEMEKIVQALKSNKEYYEPHHHLYWKGNNKHKSK